MLTLPGDKAYGLWIIITGIVGLILLLLWATYPYVVGAVRLTQHLWLQLQGAKQASAYLRSPVMAPIQPQVPAEKDWIECYPVLHVRHRMVLGMTVGVIAGVLYWLVTDVFADDAMARIASSSKILICILLVGYVMMQAYYMVTHGWLVRSHYFGVTQKGVYLRGTGLIPYERIAYYAPTSLPLSSAVHLILFDPAHAPAQLSVRSRSLSEKLQSVNATISSFCCGLHKDDVVATLSENGVLSRREFLEKQRSAKLERKDRS